MPVQRKFAARLIALLLAGTSLYAAPSQAAPQEIQTVSGGVGETGMDAIDAVQEHYSLKLVFAKANGEYLADVAVKVSDLKGNTLVDTNSQGPVLLINLMPGNYTVKASLNGETQIQHIAVHDHGLITHFIRLRGTES
jgi:hypothetical protein